MMLPLAMIMALAGMPDQAPHAAQDTYRISVGEGMLDQPASGRLLLFFIVDGNRRMARTAPMRGPFYSHPQPIASVEISQASDGAVMTITDADVPTMFRGPLDDLEGPVRVQALLDIDDTERSHTDGPGNLYSDVVSVQVDAEGADVVDLVLTNRIAGHAGDAAGAFNANPAMPDDTETLKWVRLRSEMLSDFYGRDVFHLAGVALPPGYGDDPDRKWGAVYVISGFGGRYTEALMYNEMFQTTGTEDLAPQAVHIVLDAESPLGHHAFVDSPNNGPRGTALVEEFIPYLEQQFQLAPDSVGRIVTGHSSGAWTSLWLQLQWPDVFGACWASAPDPVDFSAFQMTNLYEDESIYHQPDGTPTPSYRHIDHRYESIVAMTVEQEAKMEYAMSPDGRSGQQWDSWESTFSPRDARTGLPTPMFDPETGAIDREVIEHWKRFDITRLVAGDWERYGPVMINKVRLACGTHDSFYLNRAVERCKAVVEAKRGDAAGDGYILLVDKATHNLLPRIYQQWNAQMRAYLEKHGLQPGEREVPQ